MKKDNPVLVEKLINYQLKARAVLAKAFIDRNDRFISRTELDFILSERLGNIEKSVTRIEKGFNKILYLKKPEQQTDNSIKNVIKLLIEKYADNSKGGTATLRQVYKRMNIGWNNRQTRYMKQYNTNKPPTKMKLIMLDQNLYRLFMKTIKEMLEENIRS